MGVIRDQANQIYANGPSTSPSQPPKESLRDLFGTIETKIEDLEVSGDTITRATWAQLSAITGSRLGQRAYVEADAASHTDPVVGGTVPNAGIYAWSTSPAGWQWLRVDDGGLANVAVSVVTALWEPFDQASLASLDRMAAVRSIRDITFIYDEPPHPLRLVTLGKNAAVGNDNIILRDADGTNWSNLADKGNPPTGVQNITLSTSDGRQAIIVVDYGKLPDEKLYINDSSSTLTFSRLATKPNRSLAIRAQQIRAAAPWLDPSVSDANVIANETVIRAIKDVALYPASRTSHRITVLTYNHATFNTRAQFVQVGQTVSAYAGRTVTNTLDGGLIRIPLGEGETGARGRGAVWLDPTGLTSGIVLSNSSSPIIVNPDYISPRWATESMVDPHPEQLRVCVAGSSIVWGTGYIGFNSLLGELERFLRDHLATTYLATQVHSPAFAPLIYTTEYMSYEGQLGRWQGVGASFGCRLYGDEISIAVAKERGNAGAAVIEMLIDGEVHDTFSTFNPLPAGIDFFNFVGDGVSKNFDLGRAGTYGHVLTVNGVSRSVRLYDGASSSGGGFLESDFALVLRRAVTVDGQAEVRHVLAFKDAPANGAAIAGSYSYGETIKPGKSTVQNKLVGIGSGLESPFGDGEVAFDPSNPTTFSSGLDFRETDDRALHTWRFAQKRTRDVTFRIKSLDPRATGSTPQLFLGFVTNRAHRVMNAGIGGARADDWLDTTDLKTTRQITAFRPTHIILESATNDDFLIGSWRATRVLTGQTAAHVRATRSAFDILALSGSGDNYTVETSHIPIDAVSPFSVTFAAGATFDIAPETDVIILGDFHQDQRRICARVISSWDPSTRTATFREELLPSDLAHIDALNDLIGTTAQVRRIGGWAANLEAAVALIRQAAPDALIGIATSGIPNIQHRMLEGYRELGQRLAASNDARWIDFYKATFDWVYGQSPKRQLYLNASASTASTGASTYQLYNANGSPVTDQTVRNARIMVNGLDRTNEGCHIRGGYKRGWAPSVTTLTLGNRSYVTDQHVLEFTSDAPAAGAEIIVLVNEDTWSSDSTHPSPTGRTLLGRAIVRAMNSELQRVAR